MADRVKRLNRLHLNTTSHEHVPRAQRCVAAEDNLQVKRSGGSHRGAEIAEKQLREMLGGQAYSFHLTASDLTSMFQVSSAISALLCASALAVDVR